MATWKSESYSGRYLELTITERVDVANNKSTLYWTLTSAGGSSDYYTIAETAVTINGQQVYHKDQTGWSAGIFPAAKGAVSGTVYVAHNDDGAKTINVKFTTRVYYSQAVDYGGNMTLTQIDRSAPTVSLVVANITANGFKISASSSVTASKWWYSLNGGTSWTEFGSEGIAKETTVTGLNPNTTYSVQVRARKKSNQVDGYSGKTSCKTLGRTAINSVATVTADDDAVKIQMGLTVYDSAFYHKLLVKNGNTIILTIAGIKFPTSGTSNRTIALNDTERATLLNAMANVKSFTATITLTTCTDASCTSPIGDASSKMCTITTVESTSRPTFTDFTFVDSRGLVGILTTNTEDNKILIQSYSSLTVNAVAGTAKNGATIKAYSASIGDISKTSSTTAIGIGAIDTYGDAVELIVTCIDSRGYATSVTKTVKILQYKKPKISSVSLYRKDEIEETIQLSLRGSVSSLKPDGSTEKNGLKYAGYYYKKTTEEEWSEFASIKNYVTENGISFSMNEDQLMLTSSTPLALEVDASYDFHLVIRDQLDVYTSYDAYFVIPAGEPIISLRKRNSTYSFPRVGINNQHPTEALDVNGKIKMNGLFVGGFVGTITKGFSTYKSGGVYFYPATTAQSGAPGGAGMLEVLPTTDGYVAQRFTEFVSDGQTFVRSYNPESKQWTSWATVGKTIKTGWATISYESGQTSVTVDFGYTFSKKPAVMVSQVFDSYNIVVKADEITKTNFIARLGGGFDSSGTRDFCWAAIG